MSPTQQSSSRLPRSLGLWDALALYVGIIMGSGIFFAPAHVAAVAPGWLASALIWVIGGAIAACGALTYAESGARMPQTGGFYVYYRAIYGEAVAFVAGWAALLITFPASLAAIAVVFGEYAAALLPFARSPHWLGAAAILLASAINYLGVRVGSWAQRAMTMAKVLAIMAVCVAAFLAPGHAVGDEAVATGSMGGMAALAAVLGAVMLVLWTYDGWSTVTLVAGELREPGHTLGKMVFIGSSVLVLIYVLVQWAVLHLLGPITAAQSKQVVAQAVERGFVGGGVWVAALVALSTLGALNGAVLATSRLGYAMASDGVMPRCFDWVHQRFKTPSRAIVGLALVTLAYIAVASWLGSLDNIFAIFSFTVWLFYMLVAWALLRMRKKSPGPLPIRVPGARIAPYIVLGTGMGLNTALLADSPGRSLIGTALLLAGFPIYYIWKRPKLARAEV